MARQLAMDKVLAIKHLEQAGYSERRIAEQLGVSRKAVRNHLGRNGAKDTKAPTGSALTGSVPSKDTKALTGSNAESEKAESPQSHSRCAPFHELILSKLEQGLDAMRIYQYLKSDHGFTAKYHSVRRYVVKRYQSAHRLRCRKRIGQRIPLYTDVRSMTQIGTL